MNFNNSLRESPLKQKQQKILSSNIPRNGEIKINLRNFESFKFFNYSPFFKCFDIFFPLETQHYFWGECFVVEFLFVFYAFDVPREFLYEKFQISLSLQRLVQQNAYSFFFFRMLNFLYTKKVVKGEDKN